MLVFHVTAGEHQDDEIDFCNISVQRGTKKQWSITFDFTDDFLKVSQYSCESVIILNFEGILVFWFRCNGPKFAQLSIFDLKRECFFYKVSASLMLVS